ncbi:MAG: hypothetical protein IPI60_13045 [Saprospiraceae bacterium]|jgi:hypothetical protein|nr:hypothetical protein [Saprospiraceae bacterium]
MNQFVFESRQKQFLISAMILGLVCLLITFFTDDAYHSRFWSNILHNSVFFTGIGFLAIFVLSAKFLAYSGWHTIFKRVWESFSMFLPIGLGLMLLIIIGIWGHFHHLYHWTDKAAVETDPVLAGKSGFLNPMIYTLFTIGIVGVWIYFANRIRKISLAEDREGGPLNFIFHRKLKVTGAIFLPIAGFSSAAIIWLWIMSVDAHWYSTLFAWYTTASWLVSMLALTILLLLYLKSKGYYTLVTDEHLHDLNKYLFAFSIFWTYLWFSQYMLIWYANVGEETVYFQTRMNEYPVLFYGNLIMNFVLPFLILIRNDNKRKVGVMVFIAVLVLFGHWVDFFLMLKPGILHTIHEVMGHGQVLVEDAAHGQAHGEEHSSAVAGFSSPGLLEIGTFIGFLGLFLYSVFASMTKASMVPQNDPYLNESIHHHV